MEIYLDEKGKSIQKPENVKPRWRISGYALIESNEKILTVRSTWSDRIELPGGGIEMDEAIKKGIQRECYEETGYKIEVQEQPIYVGERNFYCTELNEYFKAVILVYIGSLGREKQDREVINTVEKDEIAKVEWINAAELSETDIHPIVWPAISKFARTQK